ncbi:OmpA family outer membrane lipoprotein Loa22 [Leptospira borgpetersenii]|uniref:OmpA-family lipoprotein n=3 Tax=Leptospira borgpetersenii TaxID=174 RepID=Q04W20_LEPBJ|nr:OmpA family protein [Leptospira borgpetersenii]EMO60391.1 OmpA family protein [Leptospira borgpetersenii serovar Pomona str. 200901868]ABJ74900.1 OmpA-family lipoprotein [Leptospira borgpetersenii serovar Hardjo-bovis str. JB197]ABJ80243.1 OmpA-family lipoprotein [Leptospira borgpetersenii serovar Hardjo-bovis str. L550]AMX59711.1 membrane protein [Leptospira borgpetersenii serovar Hardjo]AMX62939.1 membrane protein [Leptospira borgpetersenii serovar Hardjo]
MVKKILNLILLGAIAFSFTLCSSAEKKEESAAPEPSAQEQSAAANRSVDVNSPEAIADSLNEKLKDFRYPDGITRPGFSYKKADVNPGDFSGWSKVNVPVIKEGLGKLPDSYALEITGHTDAVGPEQAEGAKKGNIFYSELRANAVKQALIKQGIPANRIIAKGAGSSEPVSGLDAKDAKNRRVTFRFATSAPQQ